MEYPTSHKTLVIGARGNLGGQLMRDLSGPVGTSRDEGGPFKMLDICNPEQVNALFRQVRPSSVINTAAMTSVDDCERDPETTRAINVDGVQNLVEASREFGAKLVHLSTNYVFDGADGPYIEEDETIPLSVYGQTKLESERLVLEGESPGIVVRTAVLYGKEAGRPNFLTWAIRELLSERSIRIVTDEWANPTYVRELSDAIVHLTERSASEGVFHVAGADFLTRYEMVEALCDTFDLDASLVSPVQGSELGQDAKRPPRAGLKVDKIQTELGYSFRPFLTNLMRLKEELGDLDSLRDWP